MTKTPKLVLLLFVAVVAGTASLLNFNSDKLLIFNTQGIIGDQQRDLMYFTMLLSLIVVIPVFIMTFYIAWKYRANNVKAKYKPDWDRSIIAESVWWGVPIMLITILAIVTWNTSHDLDPFKPVEAKDRQMTVQVVALQWKWLFIYPEQGVASVNYSQIPIDTPIKYEITSDAPMNSFWIPQLGGQIYAMSGMSTNLNLVANNPGIYRGVSANISGEGFAGMSFKVKATDRVGFNDWINEVRSKNNYLGKEAYDKLKLPSKNNPITTFANTEPFLYDTIVDSYMSPLHSHMNSEEL